MAVNWTAEQEQAIAARDSNILVAAAAGSGKTAVLVERIIRRICDAENPVSVDRLLVLTFTEAAAAEMKRKIAQAIYDRLQQEPDNPWLRQQNVLVHSAHISTVHAFCKTMIQNNIHLTDLPTDFTLIDQTENKILQSRALDEVLERYYKRIDKKNAFRDLAVGYGGIKSDDNLRNTVLSLYNFVQSMAYPKCWLREAIKPYKQACETGSITGTLWEDRIVANCQELAQEVLCYYDCLAQIMKDEVSPDAAVYTYFVDLPQRFQEAFLPMLEGTASVAQCKEILASFKKGNARGIKDLDVKLQGRIKYIRERLISPVMDDMKKLLDSTEPEQVRRIVQCAPRVQMLKQLVRQTGRLHKFMKRERSALDFNDLEHEFLALLTDKQGNPTTVARKLRMRFEEILVDEYQDTNDVQDTIFRMISREEKNIFMVGDLKQCIYQFRNAKPDIFAEKYRTYGKTDDKQCIQLQRNFRSRREVLDFANGVFAFLMTRQLGGLDYTPKEYLIPGASYPEGAGNVAAEILVTDANKDNYTPDSAWRELESQELEAITVAERIQKLVAGRELLVTDKETGELRPVRLGDITILMQTSTHMGTVSRILEEHGIPVADTVGRKYLDSLEVLTVLNFLQVIDNPLQDIPLLAVLRSAMFDFSPEELAKIRLCAKGNFYHALCAAANQGNTHAGEFLQILSELRDNAVYMGVDELIWKICHELHFMALVGAMPGGKLRQENLNMLYEHGADFEQGVLHGLFNFVGYIELLRAGKADLSAAQPLTEEGDMVSISTIHKSKGLEYPVVILFDMGHYFMEADAGKPVIWHEADGIAMDWVDTVNRVRYGSLPKHVVRRSMIQDGRSESLRVLYVAMTRAKEKLIFSCAVSKSRNQWKEAIFDAKSQLHGVFARRCTSMRDWVLSAVLPHPEAKPLRELAERGDILPDLSMDYALQVQVMNHETTPLTCAELPQKTEAEETARAATLPESVSEKLAYQYPHKELGLTPIKLSISELKRRQMPEEDYIPGVLRVNRVVLAENAELGAAEIGTINHYVLQHLDETRTESLAQVEEQLEEMVQSGMISQRQRGVVAGEKLYGFFCHPLGKRLKASQEVCREFDFYMEIPAAEVTADLPETDQKETVLLQGIADCFFYEEDGAVLIDYKTDRVSAEKAKERAQRYETQLECYTRGLNAILPCPIKERYLYFLHCGEAVQM